MTTPTASPPGPNVGPFPDPDGGAVPVWPAHCPNCGVHGRWRNLATTVCPGCGTGWQVGADMAGYMAMTLVVDTTS